MTHPAQTIDFSKFKVSCKACSLQELCLPRGLNSPCMDKLEEIVKRSRPVQRGDLIFRAGDKLTNIYAVRSGTVKLSMLDESGADQILGFLFPGEIIGLDGIDKQVHQVSATAIEVTTYCSFPFSSINNICKQIPDLQMQLMRLMSRQLTAENELILTIGKKNADEKIAIFLLTLSARFHALGFSATEFRLSMSRQDIANYLGLTIETVSRVFSRLQRDSIIKIDRKLVTIQDRDALVSVSISCQTAKKLTGHD